MGSDHDEKGRFIPGNSAGGRGNAPDAKPRRRSPMRQARTLVKVHWNQMDQRSAPARALKDHKLQHQEQCGGEVTFRQAVIIDKLSKLQLVAEIMEGRLLPKIIKGETLADGELSDWTALVDRITRLCEKLGLRQERQEPRSLAEWVEAQDAAQEAPEESETGQDTTGRENATEATTGDGAV